MDKFKRLLVGLDFSSLDQTLVAYTSFIAKQTGANKIYFIHVERDLTVGKMMYELTSEEPLDEFLLRRMKDFVGNNFENLADYDVQYEVLEGSPAKKLLQWVQLKNIDLMIIGQHGKNSGGLVIPSKIARNAHCSVLFVPPMSKRRLEKFVVPVDFSKASIQAMNAALSLAALKENSEVMSMHIYDLPELDKYGDLIEKRYKPIMESAVEDEFKIFEKELIESDVKTSKTFQVNWNYQGALYVEQFAKAQGADIIVISAQGKSALGRIFLGSFTEKLIKQQTEIPVLVYRDNKIFRAPKQSYKYQEVLGVGS